MSELNMIMTREACANKLEQISKLFVKGSKITLIVRQPSNDNADFILTDDQLPLAMAAIERRINGQNYEQQSEEAEG